MPPAGTSEKYPDYTSWTLVSDLAKNTTTSKTTGTPMSASSTSPKP
jgi:hypothetical protein